MCTPVKYHDTILFCTTEKLFARTLGNPFYQDFINISDTTRIRFSRKPILQSYNLIKTTHFNIFRDIILQMLGSIRAGAF